MGRPAWRQLGPGVWAGQLQTGAFFPRGRDGPHDQPHTVQMEGRDSGRLLPRLTSSELGAPGLAGWWGACAVPAAAQISQEPVSVGA